MEKPKIFKMGDDYWWAGYDLESCIADFENYTGNTVDPNKCRMLSEQEIRELHVADEEGELEGTFVEVLQQMVVEKQNFPCFFASIEW